MEISSATGLATGQLVRLTRRWREMVSNLWFRARLVTILSLRLRPVRPPQNRATPSHPSLRFSAGSAQCWTCYQSGHMDVIDRLLDHGPSSSEQAGPQE